MDQLTPLMYFYYWLLMSLAFYFFLVRPQQNKRKKHQKIVRGRFNSLKARFLLLFTTVILGFVAAELYVRTFVPVGGALRIGQDDHIDDQVMAAAFKGDSYLFWRLKRDARLPQNGEALQGLISNAQGFRREQPVTQKKESDEIRILFVGDSTTFGWRLLPDQTFSQLLEDRLRKQFPDVKINCLNAGVPAYTLFQGWRYLSSEGIGWEPDLIVLGFGSNEEFVWSGMGDVQWARLYEATKVPAVLQFSELAHLLWFALFSHSEKPESPERPRLKIEEFSDLLTKVGDLAASHDSDLLVLALPQRRNFNGQIPPNQRDSYQQENIRFGETLALAPGQRPAFIDGTAVLQQLAAQKPGEALFFDRVHPTPPAAESLAEALLEKISPWVEQRKF